MIVMTQGEYCHCDYCKCKHGYGQDSKVCNIIVMRNFNEMYFRDIKGVRDTDKMCSDVLLCRTISFDIIFLIYCYDLEIYSIFLLHFSLQILSTVCILSSISSKTMSLRVRTSSLDTLSQISSPRESISTVLVVSRMSFLTPHSNFHSLSWVLAPATVSSQKAMVSWSTISVLFFFNLSNSLDWPPSLFSSVSAT